VSLSSRSRMRMRSARNQERGCVFLRLLSPTRKTPASIFRRLPRWCNPCESCPMNHWQWDPRNSLRMRLRILLEGSFVFACCLLPTPCAKMSFCLSAPAHCWKQPESGWPYRTGAQTKVKLSLNLQTIAAPREVHDLP